MKQFTNEKLIKRNSRLGQVATFLGLAVLIGGMVISFRNPSYSVIAWLALLLGFGLSQMGLYFGNRWGRHPRPDELIDQGLKGLNDQYSIFHYRTPAAHLLIGPAGIWVLIPYYKVGKIVYEKGRWKQKGGGFMQRYLRAFAQEGIGRPDLEAPAETSAVSSYIKKNFPEASIPEVKAALVFTNEKAELELENAPILSIPIKKLKETIRKTAKDNLLSPDWMRDLNSLFE